MGVKNNGYIVVSRIELALPQWVQMHICDPSPFGFPG